MGTLTVHRERALWRDCLRAYTVEVDGEPVATIGAGKQVALTLEPGPHAVRLTIDWCSSPTLEVSGAEDTQLVAGTGGNSLTAPFDIVLRQRDYISLEFA
ncbi:MAG: hypothetical protein IE933_02775 [Sphingomonadales bacterium]|nr:hypothetical protein [Sphingomonadales bacterium]MBD3775036.1 hypothetical protein [Paracoccaceae bacterium]